MDPYSGRGRSRSEEPYERWYVNRGWRVDGDVNGNGRPGGPGADEGEPRLVELHSEVADTIIRTEELVLSERDEVSAGFLHSTGVRSREMKLTAMLLFRSQMALHLKCDWDVSPPPLSV